MVKSIFTDHFHLNKEFLSNNPLDSMSKSVTTVFRDYLQSTDITLEQIQKVIKAQFAGFVYQSQLDLAGLDQLGIQQLATAGVLHNVGRLDESGAISYNFNWVWSDYVEAQACVKSEDIAQIVSSIKKCWFDRKKINFIRFCFGLASESLHQPLCDALFAMVQSSLVFANTSIAALVQLVCLHELPSTYAPKNQHYELAQDLSLRLTPLLKKATLKPKETDILASCYRFHTFFHPLQFEGTNSQLDDLFKYWSLFFKGDAKTRLFWLENRNKAFISLLKQEPILSSDELRHLKEMFQHTDSQQHNFAVRCYVAGKFAPAKQPVCPDLYEKGLRMPSNYLATLSLLLMPNDSMSDDAVKWLVFLLSKLTQDEQEDGVLEVVKRVAGTESVRGSFISFMCDIMASQVIIAKGPDGREIRLPSPLLRMTSDIVLRSYSFISFIERYVKEVDTTITHPFLLSWFTAFSSQVDRTINKKNIHDWEYDAYQFICLLQKDSPPLLVLTSAIQERLNPAETSIVWFFLYGLVTRDTGICLHCYNEIYKQSREAVSSDSNETRKRGANLLQRLIFLVEHIFKLLKTEEERSLFFENHIMEFVEIIRSKHLSIDKVSDDPVLNRFYPTDPESEPDNNAEFLNYLQNGGFSIHQIKRLQVCVAKSLGHDSLLSQDLLAIYFSLAATNSFEKLLSFANMQIIQEMVAEGASSQLQHYILEKFLSTPYHRNQIFLMNFPIFHQLCEWHCSSTDHKHECHLSKKLKKLMKAHRAANTLPELPLSLPPEQLQVLIRDNFYDYVHSDENEEWSPLSSWHKLLATANSTLFDMPALQTHAKNSMFYVKCMKELRLLFRLPIKTSYIFYWIKILVDFVSQHKIDSPDDYPFKMFVLEIHYTIEIIKKLDPTQLSSFLEHWNIHRFPETSPPPYPATLSSQYLDRVRSYTANLTAEREAALGLIRQMQQEIDQLHFESKAGRLSKRRQLDNGVVAKAIPDTEDSCNRPVCSDSETATNEDTIRSRYQEQLKSHRKIEEYDIAIEEFQRLLDEMEMNAQAQPTTVVARVATSNYQSGFFENPLNKPPAESDDKPQTTVALTKQSAQ